jgi:hypothetical protein
MPSQAKGTFKQITIHIPIPGLHQNEEKNALLLNASFENFANRSDYILDYIRLSINICFANGFTVNGVKVKFTINARS